MNERPRVLDKPAALAMIHAVVRLNVIPLGQVHRTMKNNSSRNWSAFRFLIGVIFAGLALGASSASAAPASKKPNIVFILADDLGYAELGCYGQKKIRTPCIDRMAGQGIRFTQNYAGAPVCAPSRYCLMTGKHGGHAWIRDNREIKP